MSLKHNQFKRLPNQSKFHEELRDLFISSPPFKNYTCYQEVNVRELFPYYEHAGHHYDWYIKELSTIIELHGKQHYEATNFGNLSYRDTRINFNLIKSRDSEKKGIAIENGFTYLEVGYKLRNKLTSELIIGLMNEQQRS